jgi:hypothetical protein
VFCSRRSFLMSAGAAAAFSASPLRGMSLPLDASLPSPCLLRSGSEYAPFVERFLPHISPGSDGFIAEKYAGELTAELISWRQSFVASARDLSKGHDLLSETLEASLLNHVQVTPLRTEPPVTSEKVLFAPAQRVSRRAVTDALHEYLASFSTVEIADLQLGFIGIVSTQPLAVKTKIYYDLIGPSGANQHEERTGLWDLSWRKEATETGGLPPGPPLLNRAPG